MPNSLRLFVVSLRNAILRRKPKPLQDANISLTSTADHDVAIDKNPSTTHDQPPPLSTSYGPVNNGELSLSIYATSHPNFEANDTRTTPLMTSLEEALASSQGLDKKSHAQAVSDVDIMKHVRLPDYLQREPSLASIAQIAYERRARRAAVKENAERRVQSCEAQLQIFRQELSDAERELQEVESNVHSWQTFFSQFAIEPAAGEDGRIGTAAAGRAIVRSTSVDVDATSTDHVDNTDHMHNLNISGYSSTSSSDS